MQFLEPHNSENMFQTKLTLPYSQNTKAPRTTPPSDGEPAGSRRARAHCRRPFAPARSQGAREVIPGWSVEANVTQDTMPEVEKEDQEGRFYFWNKSC